jgi:hypothetical protein
VPFKIYGEQEFTDALFPWFEPSTAPANADGLRVLLERPGVVQRLELIGVRYVVWLDGQTRKTDGGGSIACGAGPGGAGCIGVGWWEKQSGYVASVWDMQTGSELGSVSTDVTGTSVLIGAVAPIPIIAPVQRTACNRLAEQLRSFLGGADLVGGGAAAGGSCRSICRIALTRRSLRPCRLASSGTCAPRRYSRTMAPMALTSLSTPLEVSDCVTMTARTPGFSASAVAMSAGSTT